MRHSAAAAVLLALLVALPCAATAQDVQYTTSTKLNMQGALGKAVEFAARLGGGSTETEQTTSIQGARMRFDGEGSSTIVDYDNARMVQIDHEAKTYSVTDLNDLAARMGTTLSSVEAGQVGTRSTIETDSADIDLDIKFSIDEAGDTKSVSGYPAQRYFMTVDVQGEGRETGSSNSQELGRLVMFTDMWNSSAVPAADAMRRFQSSVAGAVAAKGSGGLGAAMGQDPRVQPAMARAAAEATKLDGMTVQSTSYFVFVMPGEQFDREALLAGPAEQKQESVAKKAASGALRGALGRFGRRSAEPEEPAEAEEQPTQRLMMSMTEELRDIKTTTLPASLFDIPEGYREVASSIPTPG